MEGADSISQDKNLDTFTKAGWRVERSEQKEARVDLQLLPPLPRDLCPSCWGSKPLPCCSPSPGSPGFLACVVFIDQTEDRACLRLCASESVRRGSGGLLLPGGRGQEGWSRAHWPGSPWRWVGRPHWNNPANSTQGGTFVKGL